MTAPLHERLAQLAELVQISAPGPWHSDGVEVYEAGCDDHPVVSCECNTTCRLDYEQAEIAKYIAAAQPANVAKLCEQVREAEEAISLLLIVMNVAGWEGDFAAEQGRQALKSIRGEQ